ncbi:hypothetical protein [Streptomyces sp. SHP 1-2]|uniref:hypothetical protein n=1 Tax=Streptomyces sp. SHP 1-2 TaxID=2769489 RepID=UPI002238055C|nr:hypothetical protein [Streptomyces sp. SHP 1-2]MCW5253974.1 hypothetical protein [Streptomyces sp. SHP 1-2]
MSGTPPKDPFEERLSGALREAGDGFDTDRAALVAAGRSLGRRAALRRRAGILGGAAGIALIGVGGALVLPGAGPDDGAAHRASAAAGPATRPERAPAAFTSGELLREFKAVLPRARFSGEEAQGTGARTLPYARLVLDDGRGAAAVGIGFARLEPGSAAVREATRCPDRALTPHDSCVTERLPDGSVLTVFQGYEYPDRRVDTKWWSADLVTARGLHISLSEWNSPAEKGAPVSRPEPPLSTAQLRKAVTAGVWRRVADTLPDPAKQGTRPPAPPSVPGEAVRATLARLLPRSARVVAQGAQETEFAHVVVDDGRGRSLVQVNVQPRTPGDRWEEGAAEPLPDGSLVLTSRAPGEKGGPGVVQWTADTLRPGGLRVAVSAFNSGTQHGAATRDTPALTMAQLEAITLSPEWDALL